MGKNAATQLPTALPGAEEPASSPPSLAPVIDINIRHIGRKPQAQILTGATAPEGWIKKIDRPREGKVWVGYFHLYVADSFGRPVRKKKEKTLGPGTMPKHEAQQKLAEYIEECTGKLIHQGDTIESFADLWKAFSAVKAGSWGKKMREDLQYLFKKHVLPVLGQYSPRKITLTPLQLLVNKMAEDGYSKSAVKHVRSTKISFPRTLPGNSRCRTSRKSLASGFSASTRSKLFFRRLRSGNISCCDSLRCVGCVPARLSLCVLTILKAHNSESTKPSRNIREGRIALGLPRRTRATATFRFRPTSAARLQNGLLLIRIAATRALSSS
jgi:hypothetical protein